MKVRTKDGDHDTLSWPLQPHCIPKSIPHTPNSNNNSTTSSSSSSSTSSIDYPLQQISTTFESILSTIHSSSNTSTDTTSSTTPSTDTTTNSTLPPPPSWKVELLRGFVYPPSATILSNVYWDGDEECGGLVSDGICSSPPIVELIRDDNDGSAKSSRITHYSSS